MLCKFTVSRSPTGNYRHTCSMCGRSITYREKRNIKAMCSRKVKEYIDTVAKVDNCVYRSESVLVIPGDILDCKHRNVNLLHCDFHDEAVTLWAVSDSSLVSSLAKSKGINYTGKTCNDCSDCSRDLKAARSKLNALNANHNTESKQTKFTLTDITIIITAFKRPAALARLVASIERYYPTIPRVIKDTGGNISLGRNLAVNDVKTRLTLVIDDDFEFTQDTRIGDFLDVLNHDASTSGELAGVSGTVVEKNRSYSWCHTFDVFRGRLRMRPSNEEWRATDAGTVYRPCDVTINFFLAHTEVLRETQWDEELQLEEHRDWFLRVWNLRKWKWGWVPSVTCLHHRDRNPEYTKFRNRSFLSVAQKKHSLKFDTPILNGMLLPHINGITSSHLVGKPQQPTAVILGVGHSNTTITTKQLESLGFNLHDADDEYAESITVRRLNDFVLSGKPLRIEEARKLLKSWSRPWAVKDPRFAKGTLPKWMQIFVEYTPILFWIDKPINRVSESYERRGESASNVVKMYDNCRRYYDMWPWAKYHIKTDQIAEACKIFDHNRT